MVSQVSTPKAHGTPVSSADLHHAGGRLGADEVVVVGLAPDHRAEARDAREAPAARPRSEAASGSSKAPGNVEDLVRRTPASLEGRRGAGDQSLGQLLVEAGDGAPRKRRSPAGSSRRRRLGGARARARSSSLVEVQALVVEGVPHPLGLRAQVCLVVLVGRRARSGSGR